MDKALFAEEPDAKMPTAKEQASPCCCGCPKRYLMVAMTAIGMCISHAMRVNVAVTVVTILDKTASQKVGTTEAKLSIPTVDWDAKMVGFLHAAFYIGYILTQIPGGYLATKIASHKLFGGCILVSCSLNLLLPLGVQRLGYEATCIIRGLQGLSEGSLYPSCYAVMRHWTVPLERSSMGAMVLTGIYLGPVIGLSVSGIITHYIGWQYVYYVHGGLGIFWFVIWLFTAYEVPSDHPGITQQELKYIVKQQGETAYVYENDRVPWCSIFTSMPVWALNVCNFARSFVFFLLLTNEPAYLNVFGFTLAENGLFSALPHLLMTILSASSGPLADYLIANPMLTATQVRKIFTCVGFGTEAVCLLFLFFIADGITALIFLTIGVGISGFTISGWQINHLDLAPRYASVLVALSTMCGTVAGIINPIIVGTMTSEQTVENWQNVFILTSGILMFSVIFYGIFGSASKQSWAEPPASEVRLISSKADPLAGSFYKVVPAQLAGPEKPTHQVVLRRDPRDSFNVAKQPEDSFTVAKQPGDSFETELQQPCADYNATYSPDIGNVRQRKEHKSAQETDSRKHIENNPFEDPEEEMEVTNPFYSEENDK